MTEHIFDPDNPITRLKIEEHKEKRMDSQHVRHTLDQLKEDPNELFQAWIEQIGDAELYEQAYWCGRKEGMTEQTSAIAHCQQCEQRGYSKCKSCGASIILATNIKTGKTSCFDSEPVKGGQWGVSVDHAALYKLDARYGYVSHFATCPQANQHRKR